MLVNTNEVKSKKGYKNSSLKQYIKIVLLLK